MADAAIKATGRSEAAEPPALVSFRNVSIRFGGVVALDDVSFDVPQQSICGLIGPNGAGKTTLFNCLSRLYQPSAGDIVFDGHQILSVPPYAVAGLGIARTFQNLALFDTMSVRRNMLVGAHSRSKAGLLAEALRLPSVRRNEREQEEYVDYLLRLLDLDRVAELEVKMLPFATKKRVEMGRALATQPKLLILDEPAGGLNHAAIDDLIGLMRLIRGELGTTIILVEHHLNLVMRVSDRVVVLNFGRKIAEGVPEQVRNDPEVIRSYLGSPQ